MGVRGLALLRPRHSRNPKPDTTHTPGGIIEAHIKLPGKSDTGGLWPAFWLMGNLGRATYEARSSWRVLHV